MIVRPPFRAGGDGYIVENAGLTGGSADYIQRVFTLSATQSGSIWVKRHKLGAVQPILDNRIYFNASDQLVAYGLTSDGVFRDPTVAYHVFWNTSGVWVNGLSISGTGSYATASITNPRLGYDGTNSADATFSDFTLWDGSSVSLNGGAGDPWTPEKPEGSPTDWVKDPSTGVNSGSAGNWTVNGTIEQVPDTPTDSAARSVGNHAVLNPLINSNPTTSNGNRTLTGSGNSWSTKFATLGMPPNTGIYYWEQSVDATTFAHYAGIGGPNADPTVWMGTDADTYAYVGDGYIYNNSVGTAAWGGTWNTVNDRCQVAYNSDIGALYFGVNGTWQNGATKTEIEAGTTTNAAFSGIPSDTYFPGISLYQSGQVATIYFDEASWTEANIPSGAKALATQDLPTTEDNIDDHFKALKFLGDAVDGRALTTGFDTHMSWIKRLDGAVRNMHIATSLTNAITTESHLHPSTSDALSTNTSGGVLFNSTGVTLNDGSGSPAQEDINNSGNNHIGYFWSLPDSASGSTTGSGTSKSYSARYNRKLGVELITTEGNGSGGHTIPLTLGPLLSAAPGMVIVKNLDGSNSWMVWHKDAASGYYLNLESTSAQSNAGAATAFGNDSITVDPTSSVLTLGSAAAVNGNTNNYLIMAFYDTPETFCSIFTYDGNGSSDGPVVNTDRLLEFMFTRSLSGNGWILYDRTRNPDNVNEHYLQIQSPGVETSSSALAMDWLSRGIKWRGTNANVNGSGVKYIGLGFGHKAPKGRGQMRGV